MPFFHSHQHRLFYREQGSGELLIILPGNTASSALHMAELEYFGRRFHAAVLDFLGTGQSERLASWPQDWWQQGARDALNLVEHLGAREAIFMGTSGGAVAALWAAILAPGRVRAVIADSTAAGIPTQQLQALLAERAQRTSGQVNFWKDAHGDDWEQVVEADTRLFRAYKQQGCEWFGEQLKEIRCPVLFTASLSDSLLPQIGADVASMAAQVSRSEAYLFHGGGHPLMWSVPDRFRAAADMFLLQVTEQ